MPLFRIVFIILICASPLFAVDLATPKNTNELFGALDVDQKLEDFRYVVSILKSSYGPLSRKAETAKLNFDQHVLATQDLIRASDKRGEKDEAFFNILSQFINRFQDSHLSLVRPDFRDVSLGFGVKRTVVEIEGKKEEKAILSWINREILPEKNFPLYIGDELVSIDGKSATAIADELSPQVNWSAPESKRDLLFAYIPQRSSARFDVGPLKQSGAVEVKILDQKGVTQTPHLFWVGMYIGNTPAFVPTQAFRQSYCPDSAQFKVNPEPNEKPNKDLNRMPSLISSIENCTTFKAEDLPGWKDAWTKWEEEQILQKEPFANEMGICTLNFAEEKISIKVGFVPIESFSVHPQEAYKNLYRRIFTYMEENTKGLVIDLRGNPGGDSDYLHFLLSLLTGKSMDMGSLTLPLNRNTYQVIAESYAKSERGGMANARLRKLLEDYETAIKSGQTHLKNADIWGTRDIMPNNEVGFHPYTKTLFVLTDGFCASCGDWFPGVIKANGRGTIIGTNTMGAGGHVEVVGPLPHSNAKLKVTYSLIQLVNGDLLEDIGVGPHHVNRMSQLDFRQGYQNKGGYRDTLLTIVRREIEEKVVRPQLAQQMKDIEAAIKVLDKK